MNTTSACLAVVQTHLNWAKKYHNNYGNNLVMAARSLARAIIALETLHSITLQNSFKLFSAAKDDVTSFPLPLYPNSRLQKAALSTKANETFVSIAEGLKKIADMGHTTGKYVAAAYNIVQSKKDIKRLKIGVLTLVNPTFDYANPPSYIYVTQAHNQLKLAKKDAKPKHYPHHLEDFYNLVEAFIQMDRGIAMGLSSASLDFRYLYNLSIRHSSSSLGLGKTDFHGLLTTVSKYATHIQKQDDYILQLMRSMQARKTVSQMGLGYFDPAWVN